MAHFYFKLSCHNYEDSTFSTTVTRFFPEIAVTCVDNKIRVVYEQNSQHNTALPTCTVMFSVLV